MHLVSWQTSSAYFSRLQYFAVLTGCQYNLSLRSFHEYHPPALVSHPQRPTGAVELAPTLTQLEAVFDRKRLTQLLSVLPRNDLGHCELRLLTVSSKFTRCMSFIGWIVNDLFDIFTSLCIVYMVQRYSNDQHPNNWSSRTVFFFESHFQINKSKKTLSPSWCEQHFAKFASTLFPFRHYPT